MTMEHMTMETNCGSLAPPSLAPREPLYWTFRLVWRQDIEEGHNSHIVIIHSHTWKPPYPNHTDIKALFKYGWNWSKPCEAISWKRFKGQVLQMAVSAILVNAQNLKTNLSLPHIHVRAQLKFKEEGENVCQLMSKYLKHERMMETLTKPTINEQLRQPLLPFLFLITACINPNRKPACY